MSNDVIKDLLREAANTIELDSPSKINEWGIKKLKEKIAEKDPGFDFSILDESDDNDNQDGDPPSEEENNKPPIDQPNKNKDNKVVRTKDIRKDKNKWPFGVVTVRDIKLPKAED